MSQRLTCELRRRRKSELPTKLPLLSSTNPVIFLKTTVKVPIDRSVVAARRRLCGGGGGGKRGEMRLGEKEEEAVLVAPISQFLTTSNIRMRSGAISGGLYLWVER